jgi:hypothetical protein
MGVEELSTPSLGITVEGLDLPDNAWRHIFQLPLSGSHVVLRHAVFGDDLVDFQLPLSGSRDHSRRGTSAQPQGRPKLSTPSLGITSQFRTQLSRSAALSTPSLGITGYLLAELPERRDELSTPSLGITSPERLPLFPFYYEYETFNSLSRDHENATIRKVYGADILKFFQLPLSGSPSPIPGFFGSPRLSAAAPLRTDDF